MSDRLSPKPIPRRDWLGMTGLWSAGIAVLGSIAGMARLPKPRVTPEASSKVRIGSAIEFAPGSEKIIPATHLRVVSTPEELPPCHWFARI